MTKDNPLMVYSDLKPRKGKIRLIGLGDLHLGSATVNEPLIKRVVKYCIKNNIYVIGTGDYCETATKTSPGASLATQDYDINKQIEKTVEIFNPLQDAGLLLSMHDGNHEERVFKSVGLDLQEVICNKIGTIRLPSVAFHTIKVNPRLAYDIFTLHGSGGSQYELTKLSSARKKHEYASVDIIMSGHVHESAHCSHIQYVINQRRNRVEEKEVFTVLCGSFMGYFGSYAAGKYAPCKIGTQLIELDCKTRKINVSKLEVE